MVWWVAVLPPVNHVWIWMWGRDRHLQAWTHIHCLVRSPLATCKLICAIQCLPGFCAYISVGHVAAGILWTNAPRSIVHLDWLGRRRQLVNQRVISWLGRLGNLRFNASRFNVMRGIKGVSSPVVKYYQLSRASRWALRTSWVLLRGRSRDLRWREWMLHHEDVAQVLCASSLGDRPLEV